MSQNVRCGLIQCSNPINDPDADVATIQKAMLEKHLGQHFDDLIQAGPFRARYVERLAECGFRRLTAQQVRLHRVRDEGEVAGLLPVAVNGRLRLPLVAQEERAA